MHCKRLVGGKKEFSGPYAVHKPTKAANTISVSFCILDIEIMTYIDYNISVTSTTAKNHNSTSIHVLLLPANRFAVGSRATYPRGDSLKGEPGPSAMQNSAA